MDFIFWSVYIYILWICVSQENIVSGKVAAVALYMMKGFEHYKKLFQTILNLSPN